MDAGEVNVRVRARRRTKAPWRPRRSWSGWRRWLKARARRWR